MKVSFTNLFQYATYKWGLAFNAFKASLLKVFVYFVFLNLLMLLPITAQVTQMKDFDYERFGMTFTSTTVPTWITEGIPTSCVIENNYLDCGMDYIFEYELQNRNDIYKVYFNVPSHDTVTGADEDNVILFYHHGIDVKIRGSVVRLTYIGFNGTDFEEISEMGLEEASTILFENFFQTLKPVIILPIILFAVGALFLANLVLITLLALISMLFSLNQSNYPSFKNMLKLFMLASTIPALINVILGFYGLSAFTSLTYNFITPFIALFMYRSSRRTIQIND